MKVYTIETNLFFLSGGFVDQNHNGRRKVIGIFGFREDAKGIAALLDKTWLEDLEATGARQFDHASGIWDPLTDSQAYSRPVVRERELEEAVGLMIEDHLAEHIRRWDGEAADAVLRWEEAREEEAARDY